MLLRIGLPAEALYKKLNRLLFDIRHIIQRFHDTDTLDVAVVDLVFEDIGQREGRQWARSKLTMNVPELCQIGSVVVPLKRILDTLRREIRTRKYVLDPVFVGEVVHRREEGVVLWRVNVR